MNAERSSQWSVEISKEERWFSRQLKPTRFVLPDRLRVSSSLSLARSRSKSGFWDKSRVLSVLTLQSSQVKDLFPETSSVERLFWLQSRVLRLMK